MTTALILESNDDDAQLLMAMLTEHCPSIDVLGYELHLHNAITKIKSKEPSIVFSAFSLVDGSLHDVLSYFENRPFALICMSQDKTEAALAFELNAEQFLIKPFSKKNLTDVVSRLKSIINNELSEKSRIGLRTSGGIEFIPVKDIYRIQADRSYCSVYHEGDVLTVAKSLHAVAQLLPSSLFLRVHASHLVNVLHIRRFVNADGGYVELTNGTKVSVSRKSKRQVLSRLLS